MKLSRAMQKGFRLFTSPTVRRQALNAVDAYDARIAQTCPCCGYVGRFVSHGENASALVCPTCKGWERHRLFALALQRGFFSVAGKHVLHCSPEGSPWVVIDQASPASHLRIPRRHEDRDDQGSVEEINLPTGSMDVVIAVHTFEHIHDDRGGIAEVFRVLKPGGALVAMVPMIEGWRDTFEDGAICGRHERALYFGHWDHVRYYGADFRERLSAAGFVLTEMTAGPEDSVRYGLERGEKVFIAIKPERG